MNANHNYPFNAGDQVRFVVNGDPRTPEHVRPAAGDVGTVKPNPWKAGRVCVALPGKQVHYVDASCLEVA